MSERSYVWYSGDELQERVRAFILHMRDLSREMLPEIPRTPHIGTGIGGMAFSELNKDGAAFHNGLIRTMQVIDEQTIKWMDVRILIDDGEIEEALRRGLGHTGSDDSPT